MIGPTLIPAPPAVPLTLIGLFEVPHLLVPIDDVYPNTIIGSQYIARLSSTHSTLVNFDVSPDHARKTCSLVFYLPASTDEWFQPLQLRALGGISVSKLDSPATDTTSSSTVGSSSLVGTVGELAQGGQGNLVSSAPCEAGETVGYRIDAVNGLDLQYFQMVMPASGLFMTVSD